MKAFFALFAVLAFGLVCLACPPPAAPGYEGPGCGNGPGPMPDSCPMPQSCDGQKGWTQPSDTEDSPPPGQTENVEFEEVTV